MIDYDAIEQQAVSPAATDAPAPPSIDYDALEKQALRSYTPDEIRQFVVSKAKQYGVPEDLALRVAGRENGFQAAGTSPKGATGPMQLMPGTARDMGATDRFDPQQNVDAGVKYLGQMLGRYPGDTRKALAAYNFGPGNVDANAPWPKETRAYVDGISPVSKPTGSIDYDALEQQALGGFPTTSAPTSTPPDTTNLMRGNLQAKQNWLAQQKQSLDRQSAALDDQQGELMGQRANLELLKQVRDLEQPEIDQYNRVQNVFNQRVQAYQSAGARYHDIAGSSQGDVDAFNQRINELNRQAAAQADALATYRNKIVPTAPLPATPGTAPLPATPRILPAPIQGTELLGGSPPGPATPPNAIAQDQYQPRPNTEFEKRMWAARYGAEMPEGLGAQVEQQLLRQPAAMITHGVEQLAEPIGALASDVGMAETARFGPTGPPALTPALTKQGALGLTNIIGGTMQAASPLLLPALTLNPVGAIAVPLAAHFGNEATTKGLQSLGAAPEYANLGGTLVSLAVVGGGFRYLVGKADAALEAHNRVAETLLAQERQTGAMQDIFVGDSVQGIVNGQLARLDYARGAQTITRLSDGQVIGSGPHAASRLGFIAVPRGADPAEVLGDYLDAQYSQAVAQRAAEQSAAAKAIKAGQRDPLAEGRVLDLDARISEIQKQRARAGREGTTPPSPGAAPRPTPPELETTPIGTPEERAARFNRTPSGPTPEPRGLTYGELAALKPAGTAPDGTPLLSYAGPDGKEIFKGTPREMAEWLEAHPTPPEAPAPGPRPVPPPEEDAAIRAAFARAAQRRAGGTPPRPEISTAEEAALELTRNSRVPPEPRPTLPGVRGMTDEDLIAEANQNPSPQRMQNLVQEMRDRMEEESSGQPRPEPVDRRTARRAKRLGLEVEETPAPTGSPAEPPAPAPPSTSQSLPSSTSQEEKPFGLDESKQQAESLPDIQKGQEFDTKTGIMRVLKTGVDKDGKQVVWISQKTPFGTTEWAEPIPISKFRTMIKPVLNQEKPQAQQAPPSQEPEGSNPPGTQPPVSSPAPLLPSGAAPGVTPAPVGPGVSAPPVSRDTGETHDYSSTQVGLPTHISDAMTAFTARPDVQAKLDPEKGVEDDHHITALYGLHDEDPAKVQELLKDQGPVTVTFGNASVFKGKDGKPDVLKIGVTSPDLHALNKKLAELDHTSDFPTYQPHATLAYLKPGEAEQYDGKAIPGVTGQTVTLHSLTFSSKNGQRTEIPLSGLHQDAARGPEANQPSVVQTQKEQQQSASTPSGESVTPTSVTMPRDDFEKEHTDLPEVLRNGTQEEREKEADKQQQELKDVQGATTETAPQPTLAGLREMAAKDADFEKQIRAAIGNIEALEKRRGELDQKISDAVVKAEGKRGGRLGDGRDYKKIAPGWRTERDQVSKQIEGAHKHLDELRKQRADLWSFKDVEREDFVHYLSQGKEIPPERRALYADASEQTPEVPTLPNTQFTDGQFRVMERGPDGQWRTVSKHHTWEAATEEAVKQKRAAPGRMLGIATPTPKPQVTPEVTPQVSGNPETPFTVGQHVIWTGMMSGEGGSPAVVTSITSNDLPSGGSITHVHIRTSSGTEMLATDGTLRAATPEELKAKYEPIVKSYAHDVRFWEQEVVDRRRSGATAKAQKHNDDALASARASLAVAKRMADAAEKGEPFYFAADDRSSTETSEYPIQGGRVAVNRRDSKLQIYFDEKPSKMVRENLKRDGFHWKPAITAWEQGLTDKAKRAAERQFGLRLFEAPPAAEPKISAETIEPEEIQLAHNTTGVPVEAIEKTAKALVERGAAERDGVHVKIVPHPSAPGQIDMDAAHFAVEVTRNGVREELYETPLTLDAARRAAMRKLYPSTNAYPPAAKPAAAPFTRTTPALNTPDRAKLDATDKSASDALEEVWKQERELDAEISKTKRYTKKYEALEAKRQKLRDNESKLSDLAKPIHVRHYRALLEDAAEQTSNPVLSAVARLGIEEQETDTANKQAYSRQRSDAFQQASKDTQKSIEQQLAARVPALDGEDKHESTKALLATLTPDELQRAQTDAVHDAATGFLQHPLTADDVDKRLGGALYGARMGILRQNATAKIDGFLKQYQQALNILSGGDGEFRKFKTTVEQTADPARIQEVVKDAENAVLAAQQQRRLEDEARAKVARERAESLRPINELEAPTIRDKGLWNGNSVSEGNIVSDGRTLFDTRFFADKKRVQPLRKADTSHNIVPQAKVQEAFDKEVAAATDPLRELGQYQETDKSGGTSNYAYLLGDHDKTYSFNGKMIRWIRELTGADEMRGGELPRPDGTVTPIVVYYQGGKPVAAQAGYNPAKVPGIDVEAAKSNAGLTGKQGQAEAPELRSGDVVRFTGKRAEYRGREFEVTEAAPGSVRLAGIDGWIAKRMVEFVRHSEPKPDLTPQLKAIAAELAGKGHIEPADRMRLMNAIVKAEGDANELHGTNFGLWPNWAAERYLALLAEAKASQVPQAPARQFKSGDKVTVKSGDETFPGYIVHENADGNYLVRWDPEGHEGDSSYRQQRTYVAADLTPREDVAPEPASEELDQDLVGDIADDLAQQINQQPKTPPKKLTTKQKYAAQVARRRQIYTPGNIITGLYRGMFDKVLQYREGGEGNGVPGAHGEWDVQVIATDEQGNPLPGETPRWHATPPDRETRVVGPPERLLQQGRNSILPDQPKTPPREKSAEEKLTEAARQALKELKEGPQFEREEMGERGPVFREFRHNEAGATAALKAAQGGEAIGALRLPAPFAAKYGDVDMVWGYRGIAPPRWKKGYGIAHIFVRHPWLEGHLQEMLDRMTHEKPEGPERRLLSNDAGECAVLALTWFGRERKTWLLTEYNPGPPATEGTLDGSDNLAAGEPTSPPTGGQVPLPTGRSLDVSGSPVTRAGETTPSPNIGAPDSTIPPTDEENKPQFEREVPGQYSTLEGRLAEVGIDKATLKRLSTLGAKYMVVDKITSYPAWADKMNADLGNAPDPARRDRVLRLAYTYASSAAARFGVNASPLPPLAKPPAPTFKEGDRVRFTVDGATYTGTVEDIPVLHGDHQPELNVTLDNHYSRHGGRLMRRVKASQAELLPDEKTPQPDNSTLIPEADQVIASFRKLIHDGSFAIDSNPALMEHVRQITGRPVEAGQSNQIYDLLQTALNQEIAQYGGGMMMPEASVTDALANLRMLLGKLPTQSIRSEEQIKYQQFSTPPTEALVVARVAAPTERDLAMESSAGTGGLAAFLRAAGARVLVNEITPRRAELLRRSGYEKVAQVDGEQIDNLYDEIWPDEEDPTLVVINPPFTAAGDRGVANSSQAGFNHVLQALRRLRQGGRLVAILGGGNDIHRDEGASLTAPNAKPFWRKIRDLGCSTRANVRINGKEYAKYGTTFGNRIIVIDKVPPKPGVPESPVQGDFDTLEEAWNALEPISRDRQDIQRGSLETHPGDHLPGTPPSEQPGRPGGVRGADSGAGATVRGGRNGGGLGDAEGPTRSGDGHPSGDQSIVQPERPAETDREGRSGGPGKHAGAQDDPAPLEVQQQLADAGEDIGDYVAYKPNVPADWGARPHQGVVVETQTMAAVPEPPITLKPNIPQEVIATGALSDVQLDAIAHIIQAHQHMLEPGRNDQGEITVEARRLGYFCGDGTGVGKGRIIAGTAVHHWRSNPKGKRKIVWVSYNDDSLAVAGRDDLDSVGGQQIPIYTLEKVKPGKKLLFQDGVLFVNYGKIAMEQSVRKDGTPFAKGATKEDKASGQKLMRRLAQIIEWAGEEPLIVLDECHAAKNATATTEQITPDRTATKKTTLRGRATVDLQNAIPKARVLYSSATGFSDVSNMAYANRLGLWGPGTAFKDFQDFRQQIHEGGLGVMEMVAQNLKAQGKYISRFLSYEGVLFDEAVHEITPEQHQLLDKAGDAWRTVLDSMEQAADENVGEDGDPAVKARVKSMAMSQLWGCELRFYRSLYTAMKVPRLMQVIDEALSEVDKNGKPKAPQAVVISVLETGEAQQNREMARVLKSGDDDLEGADISPIASLIEMVDKRFPTLQYETIEDEHGNKITRVVEAPDPKTGEMKPLQNQEALRAKKALLEDLEKLKGEFPDGALDQIINRYGTDKVAEMTKRAARLIRNPETGMRELISRGSDRDKTNIQEMQAFQNGDKFIALISNAASTGISLHSSVKVNNQRQRVHILLQTKWSADMTLQDLGRTHRTAQALPPVYVLLSLNIEGEKRFIATVARRLEQLGALSRGERKAGGGGTDFSKYNFESDYGRHAVDQLVDRMYSGEDIFGFLSDERIAANYPEVARGRTVLQLMGLYDPEKEQDKEDEASPDVPVNKFFNRLMLLPVKMQNEVFRAFFDCMNRLIENAKHNGTFDAGAEIIHATHLNQYPGSTPVVVFQDPITGAQAVYYRLQSQNPRYRVPWDSARQNIEKKDKRLYRVKASGRLLAIDTSGYAETDSETGRQRMRLWATSAAGGHDAIYQDELDGANSKYEPVKLSAAAEGEWKRQYDAAGEWVLGTENLITGSILSIWAKVQERTGEGTDHESRRPLKIRIAKLDNRQRLIGALIEPHRIAKVLNALGHAPTKTPDEVAHGLDHGKKFDLMMGATLKRSQVSGSFRWELEGARNFRNLFNQWGLRSETIGGKERWFLPTGNTDVLKRVLKELPLRVDQAAEEEGEGPQFERGGTGETKPTGPYAITYRAPKAGQPGAVLANRAGLDRLAAVWGEKPGSIHGIRLGPKHLRYALDKIGNSDPELTDAMKQSAADNYGQAIVIDRERWPRAVAMGLWHEGWHATQALWSPLKNHLGESAKDLLEHPLAAEPASRLRAMGYREDELAAELGAHLVAGQYERLGLSRWQSRELFIHYFTLLEKQYGAQPIEQVAGKLAPMMREALRDYRRRQAGNVAGRRGDTGRPGGQPPQGPAGGEEEPPSAGRGLRSDVPEFQRQQPAADEEPRLSPLVEAARAFLSKGPEYDPSAPLERHVLESRVRVLDERGRKPLLLVNRQALAALHAYAGAEMDEATYGITFPPAAVRHSSGVMRSVVSRIKDPHRKEKVEKLLRALERVTDGDSGAAPAVNPDPGMDPGTVDRAVREERAHVVQFGINGTFWIVDLESTGGLLSQPLFEKAAERMLDKGYGRPQISEGVDSPRNEVFAALMAAHELAFEIGARLMDPVLFSELELSRKEGAELADLYIRALEEHNGDAANAVIDEIRKVFPPEGERVRAKEHDLAGSAHGAYPGTVGRNPYASGYHAGEDPRAYGLALARAPRATEAGTEGGQPSGLRHFLGDESGTQTIPSGDEEPRLNYSGLGALKRIFLPGQSLAEVEKASPAVFEAALPAGAASSRASVILQNAMPAIAKALKGSGVPWNQMALAYVESRLRGCRDRWAGLAQTYSQLDDAALEREITSEASPVLSLLSHLEGRAGMAQNLGQTAAALAEAQDWSNLRAFLGQSFGDAARRVQPVMDPAWFDETRDAMANDPKVHQAHQIYKQNVERVMADNHALNEGVFSNALGPLDTYYPLIPIGRPHTSWFGRRLAYHKPKNQDNAFATGLSEAYDPTIAAFAQKLGSAIRANSKAYVIQTLLDSGWAKKQPLHWDGVFAGPDGAAYHGASQESSPARLLIQNGKVTHLPARNIIMPSFIERGLRPILARELADPNAVLGLMRWANMIATKGPFEFLFHSSGVLGALYANTPFLGASGLDKALSVPLAKFFAIRGKLLTIDPTAPENVHKLQELADAGALPARTGKVTYSREYAQQTGAQREIGFGPMLYGPKGMDTRARILMYDIFRAAFPHGTKTDLYHFVNQIGNYTPEFQGMVERWMKYTGIGPFATAGMTRLVNAPDSYTDWLLSWFGKGKFKNASPGAKAWMFVSGAVAALALWIIAHKLLTGKWPTEDRRAKLYQIPVGHGNGYIDAFRHSALGNAYWGRGPEVGYLNFSFFDPLALRGARLAGVPGLFQTLEMGGNAGQAFESAELDVFNSLTHPMLGPVARSFLVGASGVEPQVTGLHDNRGRPAPQFFKAIPANLKPGFVGGFAPALSSARPRPNAGFGAEEGAKAAAALRELNSFYGEIGEHTGMVGNDRGETGAWWARLLMQLNPLTTGLVGNATNPYRKVEALRIQRGGR